MAQNQYRDPVIKKIIEVLEKEGPQKLKGKYCHGDVLLAPNNQMPFCSVAIDNEAINSGDSMEDINVIPLVLTVVTSATKEIKTHDIMTGTNTLYEIIVARNEDYSLREDCLAYVLRKHAQLDEKFFIAINDAPMTADFGIGFERRGAGMYSVEGTLRITVTLYTPTPRGPNDQ